MLHKVLHTASFKAHKIKDSKRRTLKTNQQQEDDIMEDIDEANEERFKNPSSRHPFGLKSPLYATDPNAQLGTTSRTKDLEDDRTAGCGVESVNIGGLQILDHHR